MQRRKRGREASLDSFLLYLTGTRGDFGLALNWDKTRHIRSVDVMVRKITKESKVFKLQFLNFTCMISTIWSVRNEVTFDEESPNAATYIKRILDEC